MSTLFKKFNQSENRPLIAEHITSITETYEVDGETVVKVTEYTYNALGQLESETSNGITTKFEYDNYGNIEAKGVADENGDIIPETKICL